MATLLLVLKLFGTFFFLIIVDYIKKNKNAGPMFAHVLPLDSSETVYLHHFFLASSIF